MQLFLTIVIKKVGLEKVRVADIVLFLNVFIGNLVLVNSEKSWEVLEPVQGDRSVLLSMISGGPNANFGSAGLPEYGSVTEGFYFLPA